jgi:mannose-6-phosphate isomerase-like protein (cupin superfamily)
LTHALRREAYTEAQLTSSFESGSEGIAMQSFVQRLDPHSEFMTAEDCWILEAWNDGSDPAVSIARARVAPGVSTQLHRLRGVDERYAVIQGTGIVRVGDLAPVTVEPGDIVVIPAGTSQQIRNTGDVDLVFYCICTPRFSPDCYEALG